MIIGAHPPVRARQAASRLRWRNIERASREVETGLRAASRRRSVTRRAPQTVAATGELRQIEASAAAGASPLSGPLEHVRGKLKAFLKGTRS